jgi:hypothetical protein
MHSLPFQQPYIQQLFLSLPSSLFFCPSPSLLQLFPIDSTMSSSSFVVRPCNNKRKGDLAASFPVTGRCLKCFKHLLIDPFTLYAIAPGKKNCDRCNKGSESCILVSSSALISIKADAISDSSLLVGGLPVLGRHRHDLQEIS